MLIMAPADENECRQMLYTGFKHQGPAAAAYSAESMVLPPKSSIIFHNISYAHNY
jgi:deoxyxylulose-5-phosphate synthase